MPVDTTTETPELPPTRAIEELLDRLRRRLVAEVWMHGVGRTLLVAAICLLFFFLIDWILHVPSGVRIVDFTLLLFLPAVVFWRELVAKLRHIPDRPGLAVLLERAHPELHELLVSAIELSTRGERGDDIGGANPDLVARVIADAEALAGRLTLKHTTDPRPPRRALSIGILGTAATVAVLLLQRDAAAIFLSRIAGAGPSWPQQTFLLVEIPLDGELNRSRESLELSVARGRDVPVIVRAEGEIPEEIRLSFDSGHEVLLGSAGHSTFRTLLRSVQEDTTFGVSGGDDTDGTPRVAITVLQPPDVSGIAVRIVPPSYSGLEERLEFDTDVQVLAGSEITVHVLSDPLDATGIARLLPEDIEVQLARAPFPTAAPDSEPAVEQAFIEEGWRFELVAEESLRYRLELHDSRGLTNPDPGLFAIGVDPDRAPELEVIAPARGEVETVIGGALPLKVRVFDDYGLSSLSWSTHSIGHPAATPTSRTLEGRDLEPEELGSSRRGRVAIFASLRVEIADLFETREATEGEVFELSVHAVDNRDPSPQEGRSALVRVRVISADELLRRIQDRLSRVRLEVDALAGLNRDKQGYTRDLIASLESDDPDSADESAILTALGGARRVHGDARAVSRELASITEALLYSGLDSRAGAMLDALVARTLPLTDRRFHPEPWLELTELASQGSLGKADFADKLVEIVGLALAISEGDTLKAIDGLRNAQNESNITASYDTLLEVASIQSDAASRIEELLTLLSEWDNYQSVLSSTRDLLSRQKNLLDRTRKYYKDH
jgi:hypothetical protein